MKIEAKVGTMTAHHRTKLLPKAQLKFCMKDFADITMNKQ